MSDEAAGQMVTQLRLVVEAEDFDQAVAFYRDALGLTEEFYVKSAGGALVMALQAGRATLEIVNPAQRRLIDQLEVGREVRRDDQIDVAFEQLPARQKALDRLGRTVDGARRELVALVKSEAMHVAFSLRLLPARPAFEEVRILDEGFEVEGRKTLARSARLQ